MKKYFPYFLSFAIGTIITSGNIITRNRVKNIVDDGKIPVANITSTLLEVNLENRCYLLEDKNKCENNNYISGRWCCKKEIVSAENKNSLRESLSTNLGETEPYVGLALLTLGILGLYFFRKK